MAYLRHTSLLIQYAQKPILYTCSEIRKKSRRKYERMFTFLNMYSRIKILEITTDMNKGFL